MTDDVSEIKKLLENKGVSYSSKVNKLINDDSPAEAEETLEDMAAALSNDIMKQKITNRIAKERLAKIEKKYKALGQEVPEFVSSLHDML